MHNIFNYATFSKSEYDIKWSSEVYTLTLRASSTEDFEMPHNNDITIIDTAIVIIGA